MGDHPFRKTAMGWSARLVLAFAASLLAALAAADETPFSQGLLWRISRPGIEDSFVLGTIHIADPRVSGIAPPVHEALARAHTLAMEPVAETVDSRLLELEEFDDGRRLEPLIGAEAFTHLRAEFAAQGLPERVIERLKPWAAMMKVARSAPNGAQRSLDEQLLRAARARRLRVVSLELIEEQIASFDAVPLDSQVAMLLHALTQREALTATVEPTIAAWLRGDLAGLARLSDGLAAQFPAMAPHYEQFTRHLIHNRTVLLHHRLAQPLRGGRVFVAVGALHLPGEKGLLALLARDGYGVSRIWPPGNDLQ
jgi:uncharacterized protein YbaP (TraB family)